MDIRDETTAQYGTQITRGLSWPAALAIALAITALLGVIWTLCATRFETNDDVGMMLTVSGLRTGTPNPHMIFTNILLGKLLAGLYTRIPETNWYALYILTAHALAITTIVAILLRRVHGTQRWVFLGASVVAYFIMAMRLQFTSTSILVGLAGVALLCEVMRDDGGRFRRLALAGTAALLLVFAGMIRVQSPVLVLGLASPLLLLAFRAASPVNRYITGIVLLVVVGLFGIVHALDRAHYRNDDRWAAYYAYNKVRGKLHDTPVIRYTPGNEGFYRKLGWSENDVVMFLGWFYADAQHFSFEKLRTIYDTFPSRRPFLPTLQVLALGLWRGWPAVLLTIAIAWWVWSLLPADQRRWLWVTMGLLSIVLVWLSWTLRLPNRVLFPILFSVDILLLMLLTFVPRREQFSRRFSPACVALLTAVVVQLGALAYVQLYQERSAAALKATLVQMRQRENTIYLVWGAGLPIEHIHSMHGLSWMRDIDFIWLGCSTFSPLYDQSLSRYNMHDLYTALYTRPDLKLVCSEQQVPYYLQYIREHHGVELSQQTLMPFRFRTDKRLREFGVYQFSIAADD